MAGIAAKIRLKCEGLDTPRHRKTAKAPNTTELRTLNEK